MIRCVGAALRGDGNPPEVPMASENIGEVRTALRAYNGVWGIPITLKGILPLTALAEPAVAAGLCPTPQQGASPLHPFLRSPLGKRSGVHPDRSALASLDRDASRSSRFRGRLRRTLTLHLSFSGKDRSSHDAAERGARGTAGGSAPEDKERAGRSPLPLVASPAP